MRLLLYPSRLAPPPVTRAVCGRRKVAYASTRRECVPELVPVEVALRIADHDCAEATPEPTDSAHRVEEAAAGALPPQLRRGACCRYGQSLADACAVSNAARRSIESGEDRQKAHGVSTPAKRIGTGLRCLLS